MVSAVAESKVSAHNVRATASGRLSELTEPIRHLLPFVDVAAPRHKGHDHETAVELLWDKWQGRAAHDVGDGRQLFVCLLRLGNEPDDGVDRGRENHHPADDPVQLL